MSIELDRVFSPWRDEEGPDIDLSDWLPDSRSLHWKDLLERRRVVVLAEAGSGKTTELAAQAEKKQTEGCTVFAATVQDIGRRTLADAIGPNGKARLEEWRNGQEPAWFFLDSVDEAKASGVKLSSVLAEVGEQLRGLEGRAHVILSGRPSDWELRRDLEFMTRFLPLPPPDRQLPALDRDELMIRALRQERAKEKPPKAETSLVVIMAPLTRNQVETFAREKGIRDLTKFLAAIEHANLWRFARRPLDLDWLVGYWRANGEFGRLEEMLALSLKERLKETDTERDQVSPLAPEHAMLALERIGGALVLQQLNDVVVPDSQPDFDVAPHAIDLEQLLPEWSGQDRRSLMRRPIFDPARSGFVRLHNDNEGVVRSYLAARWLRRLKEEKGQSHLAISRLLFADIYGVRIVRPSMRQTAAWLSLWDTEIAGEVISRDPLLLMDAGDPGSLPVDTRRRTLRAVVEHLAGSDDVELPNQDSLKRFATSDLAEDVNILWPKYKDSDAARLLLLSMIWRGELRQCADIAKGASYGAYSDQLTQLLAGRALIAAGSVALKTEYSAYVRDRAADISTAVLSEAVEGLFPSHLSVDEVLAIVAGGNLLKGSDHRRLDYMGPRLVERIEDPADALKLLTGLIALAKAHGQGVDEDEVDHHDNPFISTIEGCAQRLLRLRQIDSDMAALVEAVAVCRSKSRYHGKPSVGLKGVMDFLQASPQRRRRTFWRLAELFPKRRDGGSINRAWQVEYKAKFFPKLEREDIDWLLEDAAQHSAARDKELAASAMLDMWGRADRDRQLLERISNLAANDAVVKGVLDDYTTPRSETAEEAKLGKEIKRLEKRNAIEAAKADRSWVDFVEELRGNPNQLRNVAPPGKNGVDARLHNVWQLIHRIGFNDNRYAVDSLAPLQPMFGDALTAEVEAAFIKYWRQWNPRLKVERPPNERNTISSMDCMGIVGVSLEAAEDPHWATKLTAGEAELAARYATLELNGYPGWLASLAQAQPTAVRKVLVESIGPELEEQAGAGHEELSDIASSDPVVASLVAPFVYESLSKKTPSATVLSPALKIVSAGLSDRAALKALAIERFRSETDPHVRGSYLAALFALDPDAGTDELTKALGSVDESARTALAEVLLPAVFGDRFSNWVVDPRLLPFESLKSIIEAAYRTIRLDEDNDHTSGVAYSPDARDHAEASRTSLFNALVETPGYATYQTLIEYMGDGSLGIGARVLASLADRRAAADSETAPWKSAQVIEFEKSALTVPTNARDLQVVLLYRLSDLKHMLVHGDFNQAVTLARLDTEVEVQNWVAHELRESQGPSYSIEREVHVTGEKEPDIRARTKSKDASVPIEIKVAESWTLEQLKDALTKQLIGQYLQHEKFGILLVVHKKSRPNGWKAADGTFLTFDQVVEHLSAMAKAIAEKGPNSPQVVVVSIDVSGSA